MGPTMGGPTGGPRGCPATPGTSRSPCRRPRPASTPPWAPGQAPSTKGCRSPATQGVNGNPSPFEEQPEPHNLLESSDSPRSPNDLPPKKRIQHRTASEKMGGVDLKPEHNERSLKELSRDATSVCLFNKREEFKEASCIYEQKRTSITDVTSRCRKCTDMHALDKCELSLRGMFKYWEPHQVQLLLWKRLKDNYSSPHKLCCMLSRLDGVSGSALSTFTKDDFEERLKGCGVSASSVWDCISYAITLDTNPLQPYNNCEPPIEPALRQLFTNLSPTKQMKHRERTGRMSLATSLAKPRRRRDKCVGQLWEFVYSLLKNKETNPSVVCWEDEKNKLFRIVNTEEIARLWGKHKGNSNMTYANMSRTMRYYREGNGAFVRNERKRVYGFGPKADFERLESKISKKLSS